MNSASLGNVRFRESALQQTANWTRLSIGRVHRTKVFTSRKRTLAAIHQSRSLGSLPPLDRPQHFAFGCHYRKSGSALTGPPTHDCNAAVRSFEPAIRCDWKTEMAEFTHSGTNLPCAVAAIADAAFLRTNSRFLAAMQRTSPEQPLLSET